MESQYSNPASMWKRAIFCTGRSRSDAKMVKETYMIHVNKYILWINIALCICGLVWAGPASAHHSVQAQFDVHKTFTITGTVSKVEWINPHSYLTLNVTDADGKVQRWAFELAAPGVLRRAGMSREDRGGLKPGDEITVTGLASKDGSNTGWLQELKLSDGRVIKLVTGPNGN